MIRKILILILFLIAPLAWPMDGFLKQSTAINVLVLMVSSTDHIAGATGLTLVIQAGKAGAALATITPTVTERSAGYYQLALTTGHTDTLGQLVLSITATGADPAGITYQVATNLPGEAVTLAGTQTFNNTGSWTGNIIGTLSTLTTYTGNTPQTGDAYARLGAPSGASIDADILTRLSTAGYTAPDNTGIANIYSRLGAPVGASHSADIAAVKADTAATLSDTNLWDTSAEARTLLFGSDTPGATESTLTAMKGATFNGATDSLEAIRDRGDAAWLTATGFSTLDAAGVRSAVGLASANLDAQLSGIVAGAGPSAAAIRAEMDSNSTRLAHLDADISSRLSSGTIAADIATIIAYIDTEIAAIKAKTDGLNFTGSDVKATLDGEALTAAQMPAIDGLTWSSAMEITLAVLSGQATRTGNIISYKKRDGTTSKISITFTSTGARTLSVIDN